MSPGVRTTLLRVSRELERAPMATQWCEEEVVWVTQEAPGLLEVLQGLLEEVLGLREEVVE